MAWVNLHHNSFSRHEDCAVYWKIQHSVCCLSYCWFVFLFVWSLYQQVHTYLHVFVMGFIKRSSCWYVIIYVIFDCYVVLQVIVPSLEEIHLNPQSRSAHLRIAKNRQHIICVSQAAQHTLYRNEKCIKLNPVTSIETCNNKSNTSPR